MWNVFAYANFYSDMKKYIENMSWMGLANLFERCYSVMLVTEFYSRLLLRSDEYENPLGLIMMSCTPLLMDTKG